MPALAATLIAALHAAKDKKPKPTPTPTDTPVPTDTPAGDNSGDAFGAIFNFLITYPWIPALIIGYIAAQYGWRKLTVKKNIAGQPLAPLGNIIKRAYRVMYREDKTPVITKPENLAAKTTWLTWQRYWLTTTLLTLTLATGITRPLPPTINYTLLGTAALLALIGAKHVRFVFQVRHRMLMQMYEVAAGEMRYLKGAELNPWAYIQISKWRDLYSPDTTMVMYPPRYRSEDPRNREAFEQNFNGTVSDSHTWTYKWESANNRVIAEPVPYLPSRADYRFPDEHPWDEFPLGLGPGGTEVTWNATTFPHALIAGTTGSGKMTAVREKVPTPSGWTTMGDLTPGDVVFDESGAPCTVTWVSDIDDQPDLFEVSFSDGSTILADAEHLWFTETRRVRESRWNARRKDAERRLLVPEDRMAALLALAEELGDEGEVTLREVADLIGISDTSPWLREVADRLGPVGEVQRVAEFRYAEQQVTQMQKVRVFDALEAWSAVASYSPVSRAAWHVLLPEFEVLAQADADAELDSADLSLLLGLPKKQAATILRGLGVTPVRREGAGSSGVSFYGMADAGRALTRAATRSHPAWMAQQQAAAGLLAMARPGDAVTAPEVAEVLGLPGPQEAAAVLKTLKVAARVERREVTLTVPAKTVRRKTPWARTYSARLLVDGIVERVQRPAHDQRHKNTYGSVKRTADILDTLNAPGGQANHAIPVAKALQLPEADLPIDPYVLGVWLGDGYSRTGGFCGIDHEIAANVDAAGYATVEVCPSDHESRHPDYRIWKSERLHRELGEQDLLQKTTEEGSRKHIPDAYLRASIDQRRALLAGLLDTDGTVAPQGTVHFDNTNETLADQVRELALSLGYRATITSSIKHAQTGTEALSFRVAWTCPESPFRLARKSQAHTERNTAYTAERNETRYITGIRRVTPEPARCIAVDSPSRLFLVGEAMIPTHNSVTQRTILMHALQQPDMRVLLIDPKRVELSGYAKHPHVLKIATELEDSTEMLEQVEAEMHSRYDAMKEAGVNHFKSMPDPPPALLLMIDETFALLSPENIKSDEGKERDEMHARCTVLIGSIARLGRAAGIHMVLATQRPDAKVIPGETRANLDARIAQGRMDTTPSLMTLDSDAATRLPAVKGRAVYRSGSDTTEFQAYFLPNEYFDQVLEMSAALATGAFKPDDFKVDPQAEQQKKRGPRFRLPLPKGVAARVASWKERRLEAVERNDAEVKQFMRDRKRRKEKALPEVSAMEYEAEVPESSLPLDAALGVYRDADVSPAPLVEVDERPPSAGVNYEDVLRDLDDVDGDEFLPDSVLPPAQSATRKGRVGRPEPEVPQGGDRPVAAVPGGVPVEVPAFEVEDDLFDDEDDFGAEEAPWMPASVEEPEVDGPSPFGFGSPPPAPPTPPAPPADGDGGAGRARGRGVIPPPPQ